MLPKWLINLCNTIQLRLSISHSLNEAIGEKDEEDAEVDVASLTRLQVNLLFAYVSWHSFFNQIEPWAAMILRDIEARRRKAMEVCSALIFCTNCFFRLFSSILFICNRFMLYYYDWHHCSMFVCALRHILAGHGVPARD